MRSGFSTGPDGHGNSACMTNCCDFRMSKAHMHQGSVTYCIFKNLYIKCFMYANILWYCSISCLHCQYGSGCFKVSTKYFMLMKDLANVLKTHVRSDDPDRCVQHCSTTYGLVPRCMVLQMPCLSQCQVHGFSCLLLKAQHRQAEMQPKYIETDRNYSYRCSPTAKIWERFHRASFHFLENNCLKNHCRCYFNNFEKYLESLKFQSIHVNQPVLSSLQQLPSSLVSWCLVKMGI